MTPVDVTGRARAVAARRDVVIAVVAWIVRVFCHRPRLPDRSARPTWRSVRLRPAVVALLGELRRGHLLGVFSASRSLATEPGFTGGGARNMWCAR